MRGHLAPTAVSGKDSELTEAGMLDGLKYCGFFAVILLVAGCSSPAPESEAPAANAQEGALPLPLPTMSSAPAVSIARSTDRLDYTYSYPGEAAGIPALDKWLRDDAAAGEREAVLAAGRGEEKGRRHVYAKRWTAQANAPGLLSLAAQYVRFTGGQEPVPLWRTMIWDRQADQPIAFPTLLSDFTSFKPSLQQRVCEAFAAERKRRESEAKEPCPPLEQLNIALVSGAVIGPVRMLRLFADPGVAAPVEEGSYEARLPVDDALVRAVRPEYRAAFAPAL